MSPSDMFEKTDAHLEKFNEEVNREAEERKLSPENKARLAEYKAEKRDILAAVKQEQAARAAEDFAKEFGKESIKPPGRAYDTPDTPPRTMKQREEQAAKNVAHKNEREQAAATSEIDRKMDQLIRPEPEKSEPEYDAWATTIDAAPSEVAKAPNEPKPEPKSLEEASRKHDLKARWAEAKENDGKGR